MNDFEKELNFDSDTFCDMKKDMNYILQRLLGNMNEKSSKEGSLTVKIDVILKKSRFQIMGRIWTENIEKLLSHYLSIQFNQQ